MKSLKIIVTMLFVLYVTNLGQDQNVSHPLSDAWGVSLEGGLTSGATDFPDVKTDYFVKGSLEYFLPTSSSNLFGFQLFGAGGYVAGKGLQSTNPLYSNIDEFRTKIFHFGGGILYSYSFGEVVQPYLYLGASYIFFDPMDMDGNEMPRNALNDYANDDRNYFGEVGVRFLVSDQVSFNMGYAYNHLLNDFIDDFYDQPDDNFHSIFGGFSYYFLEPSDADGDGVKDIEDYCENTPSGIQVDELGCPVDSDFDGVPDYLDLCADTPDNVAIDSNGCPADSDNDGVLDYLDHCPDTIEDAIVDENGCEKVAFETPETPQTEVEVNNQVVEENSLLILSGAANFMPGKSELLPNPQSGLEKLTEIIKAYPETQWIIEGHTDNTGSDEVNNKLSLNRAKSVLDYFLRNGLTKDRFEVIGAGSSKPIADNSTEFGKTVNRRVIVQERNSFNSKNNKMIALQNAEYNFASEFNIKSVIFTDGNIYCVQVSSWKTRKKAEDEANKLIEKGHSAFVTEFTSEQNINWFRVRIGYFDNLQSAEEYILRIR